MYNNVKNNKYMAYVMITAYFRRVYISGETQYYIA